MCGAGSEPRRNKFFLSLTLSLSLPPAPDLIFEKSGSAHMSIRICIRTYVHSYTFAHIRANAPTRAYAYMHTHTRVGAPWLPACWSTAEGVVIIYDYAEYTAREEIAANRTACATDK